MYALNPAHRRVAHGVRVTAMCWVEGIRPPQPEIRTTRRDAMPFVRLEVPSKNVTSRLKKCYSVYESVWEGSNIFARRVTVDEYKVPSKMSTNTSLVRTPSTDSHVEGVLRHHPCYFSNISAIFHWYTQSMVTLNVTTK